MAYAAQSDLCPTRITSAELAQLTDDSGENPPQIQAGVVSTLLEEASGKIDSYCRGRYATPLQQCDDVKSLCIDITMYLLFTRRRNTKVSETARQRYDDAIDMLKGIAKGTVNLDVPIAATPQSAIVGPQKSCKPERFSEKNLEGFC